MPELIATISLEEDWASRVIGGIPSIPPADAPELFERLRQATGERLVPGAAIDLHSPTGDRVGFGIHDPDNGLLRTLPAGGDERLDQAFFRRRVEPAIALRDRLGLVGEDTAYRLINSEGDGLSGFVVDVLAGHVVIYTYSEAFEPLARLLAGAIDDALRPHSIIGKVRPAGETMAGRLPVASFRDEVLPPRQVIVTEDDARYETHLLGGLNTGLFTDMRDVRRAIRPWVRGQRVLNTFAYTGSFSVVSVLAGAKSVTTVDFAAGALQWAKTNFRLNDLPVDDRRHRFVRGDVFDFLKTARRQQQFDVVILDPPATSSAPGHRWHLKSDYDRLIGHALRVMPSGGMLVVAANSFESRPEKLESQIRAAARDHGRRLRLAQSFGLPADFPTQMIHPAGRYLKCYFLLVE